MPNAGLIALGLAVAPLSACMTPAASGSVPGHQDGDTCRAQPGQPYIGRLASQTLAVELLSATSAREIRWVPPGTMVTMDYKYGRLTVAYDETMRITSIACS